MANPPPGSSLLFGALAVSGRIKERKNGNYRMVLNGVEEIDWFTDRPDRVAGEWSPKKLVKKWNALFGYIEPNAQATFKISNKRELVTFEMLEPRLNHSTQQLSFKIRGIGKKNKDLLAGLENERLTDASLFIDDATYQDNDLTKCFPSCQGENLVYEYLDSDLSGGDFTGANLIAAKAVPDVALYEANLRYANLSGSILTDANLANANLTNANLTDANLSDANLTNADLTGSNLTNANLTGADLRSSNLNYTDLSGANLNYTDLTGATLDLAIWEDTMCPDGTFNSGTSPCTTEQLTLG